MGSEGGVGAGKRCGEADNIVDGEERVLVAGLRWNVNFDLGTLWRERDSSSVFSSYIAVTG